MEIERRLFPRSDIEYLVDDQKPHSVRQFEELGSRRVVGHADRVAAHFTEYIELTLRRTGIERRAQGAEIVMLIGALDIDALAVDVDARLRIKTQGANAKACLVLIDGFYPDATRWSPPRSEWGSDWAEAPTVADWRWSRSRQPSRWRSP